MFANSGHMDWKSLLINAGAVDCLKGTTLEVAASTGEKQPGP